MYSQDYIQNITTKRIASFDGLVQKTKGVRAQGRDGKWRYDLCGNIGLQNALGAQTSPSGHLMHSRWYDEFIVKLTEIFQFPHALPVSSGSKGIEFALKLAHEKSAIPPDEASAIACGRGFHGRNIVTDALSGNDLAPLVMRKNIHTIPFYSKDAPAAAEQALDAILGSKNIRPFCFLTELFQGEGGFNSAPASFFVPLFARCRQKGITIIIDEVQTTCRTGEPLLAERLDLLMFRPIVVIGKITQTAAVLFPEGYDADKASCSETNPGGSGDQLRAGVRILNTLSQNGYWGRDGKIMKLEASLIHHFETLAYAYPDKVAGFTVLGAMAALQLRGFDKKECTQAFVDILAASGIWATTCGRKNSYKVRFYFPFIVKPEQLRRIFAIIEKAVQMFGMRGKGT